jgi:F0F1-type ATP synthase membrane subunit b/b'
MCIKYEHRGIHNYKEWGEREKARHSKKFLKEWDEEKPQAREQSNKEARDQSNKEYHTSLNSKHLKKSSQTNCANQTKDSPLFPREPKKHQRIEK